MDKLFSDIYNVYRDSGCAGFGHSYLLKRDRGNLFLPRFGVDTTIKDSWPAIEKVGGIDIILITDYHFGGGSCEELSDKFSAEIFSSSIEKPKLKKKGLKQLSTFSYERQMIAEDLEIIPVPGHTSGGVCLLWESDSNKYLFTGDFLYFDGNTWVPGAKTKRKIEDSLSLLKELDFDTLVGCGSDGVAIPYIKLADKEEKVCFIEEVLSSFKK